MKASTISSATKTSASAATGRLTPVSSSQPSAPVSSSSTTISKSKVSEYISSLTVSRMYLVPGVSNDRRNGVPS